MSTYRPPERCSVPCAGQRQRRTHRPQPCISRPPSPVRKLLAAFRRLQSVEFLRRPPLRLRMYLSRKRTPPSRSRRKRKRQGSGQRRYMIIRARCADAPHCHCLSLLVNDGGADSSDFASVVFVGGKRSPSTSGGDGTRDGENVVRLVRTYPNHRPKV